MCAHSPANSAHRSRSCHTACRSTLPDPQLTSPPFADVVYDTFELIKRYSVDEYVWASVGLYLARTHVNPSSSLQQRCSGALWWSGLRWSFFRLVCLARIPFAPQDIINLFLRILEILGGRSRD